MFGNEPFRFCSLQWEQIGSGTIPARFPVGCCLRVVGPADRVLAAVVGAVAAGGTGALGAAGGVAIVTLSYVLSTLVIAHADAVNPRLVLPVGLGAYITKLTLLGGVLFLVAASDWAGLRPFSLGIVAGVVGWTGAHIWWISTVHARR